MILSQFVNRGSDADLVKSMVSTGQIDEELAKSMTATDKSRDNCADGDNNEGDEETIKKGDGCDGGDCADDDLKKSGDTNEADEEMLEKSGLPEDGFDNSDDDMGDDEEDNDEEDEE